ncbi:unnamed protein product [Brachionus calyciflorus]|uniref:Uncharacterized protein n=1 Tax=Brachionus calyciflorus TaxID=104777 RepID=A0A813RY06_9BILA|nr:unnamed protein product [Brachionus calyciflorus]
MSENNPNSSNELNLLQHLRSFIHLTTQAPLEQVCKSSLFILTRVPSTRHAVIEYISTFYRVTTYLHLRFNLNQKKANYPDIQTDTKNIQQINQVIDYIESSLIELIEKPETSEFWCVELSQPLLELIGDIVLNTAISFADSQGLTNEEIASFKLPSISDGLEIWNNQCRPTQSILNIIKKCLIVSNSSTQSTIADFIFATSTKYNLRFDWFLCYLSPFKTELLIEKFLCIGLNEYLASTQNNKTQFNEKLMRVNAINFYALNYSDTLLSEIKKFLKNSNKSKQMFLLRLASEVPALLSILLNKLLDQCDYDGDDLIKNDFFSMLVKNDQFCIAELFHCAKQINNSVAVYDIITNVLDWLDNQDYSNNDYLNGSFKTIQTLIVSFLDELISNVYCSQSENVIQETQGSSELANFLKSLNSINNYSLKSMIKKITKIIRSEEHQDVFNTNYELFYKLILLIGINEDSISTIELMSSLFRTTIPKNFDSENLLNKLRLEINPFHAEFFEKSVKNAIEYFKYEFNDMEYGSFVSNLVIIHEWDLLNQFYVNQNLSTILLDSENFVSILIQLKLVENTSLQLIQLLNKIFYSNEPDLASLKLNISDLISISNVVIKHFFTLLNSIEEDNVANRIQELNELTDLVQNICVNQLNNQDESNPFKNMLLRNLIDTIFDSIQSSKPSQKEEVDVDFYDENFNLFSKNINLINEELMTNKSKLKAIRNSLIDYPLRRLDLKKNQLKSVRHLVVLNLLEVISMVSESEAKTRDIKSNLAQLLVQKVLLDTHFVDYQWPGSSSEELDDNFDNEIEALKLFIERDMSVQNTFENRVDNQIVWLLLEFIADDEQAFLKAGPLIRSLLASLIIQWESYQEQPTRNIQKSLGITIRLLNLINKSNLLKKPFCYIIDIIPMLSSFETHILLLIIWRSLKKKMIPNSKVPNNPLLSEISKNIEMKHLKYIFHKNIGKLCYLYPKFFQNIDA